ncbi:MAG: TRAP transporter small permease [Candidatus Odyssella sp.]|nr:TRAP transporter small permease [Candidatus Odyssella sp.]
MSETAEKSKLDAAIDRVATWTLGIVASAILFAMMTLAFVDVWGRYLLRKPVFGGYEVTEFMMGVLIFASLPLLCAREGHVTIDILDHVIPDRFARWQRLFVNVVSAAALGAMGWQLFLQHRMLAGNNEVTMTLKIPHAPFALGFSIMAAVAMLACLANAWGYLRGTRTPTDAPS